MLDILFWASLLIVVYHHLIYPVLLRALARLAIAKASSPIATNVELSDTGLPTVTLIIPAHNESAVILHKLDNIASLDYPAQLLTVDIALDGCSDETEPLCRRWLATAPHLKWTLTVYDRNVGKIAVLNDRVTEANSDIVALSDASALIQKDALRRAARHFLQPSIDVVCPAYSVAQVGHLSEKAYWTYQTRMKADESLLCAPMGAHGPFYLFRKRAWAPLKPDTINDDFILPMQIVRAGGGCVYDANIMTEESEPSGAVQEFGRRVRIGAGNLQQVMRLIALADPRRPALAFVFASGKGLRAMVPFLLIIAFAASVAGAIRGDVFFKVALALELACVPLVFIRGTSRLPASFVHFCYLLQGHAAAAIGSCLLLTGQHTKAWRVSSAAKRHTHTRVPNSI